MAWQKENEMARMDSQTNGVATDVATASTVHFHSGDERFCGSQEQARRFTPFDVEVTCAACKANDTAAWRIVGQRTGDDLPNHGVDIFTAITAPSGVTVLVDATPVDDAEIAAIPEYIVRAANAFPRLVDALKKAYHELNEIHARDGVPWTGGGFQSSVDPDYFSSVVEECRAALQLAEREKGIR